mmetsp:Transcript_4349/g.7677  ORF Transcript_4349/g.7677 Transcript_4349/m.7677 type:complete len:109 (-) Transcript_4349:951-1277(-)
MQHHATKIAREAPYSRGDTDLMSTSRLTPFKLLLGLSAPLRDSKLYKRVGLENTRAIKSMSVMRLPTNWAKKLVAAVGSMISMLLKEDIWSPRAAAKAFEEVMTLSGM